MKNNIKKTLRNIASVFAVAGFIFIAFGSDEVYQELNPFAELEESVVTEAVADGGNVDGDEEKKDKATSFHQVIKKKFISSSHI